MTMRLITWKRLEQWGKEYGDAKNPLNKWAAVVEMAEWSSLAETRRTYPHADEVIVKSGRPVTVFNIKGDRYRLITAVHYNTGCVYAMRFMTHAEYDKEQWKETL